MTVKIWQKVIDLQTTLGALLTVPFKNIVETTQEELDKLVQQLSDQMLQNDNFRISFNVIVKGYPDVYHLGMEPFRAFHFTHNVISKHLFAFLSHPQITIPNKYYNNLRAAIIRQLLEEIE